MARYVIPNNPQMDGMVALLPNISFANPGQELCLQMLKPCFSSGGKGFPLVLFIQGSGWTKPLQFYQLPQFVDLVRRGFVLASVTHRSCQEAPAPAFLKDVKGALRFLRAHAAEFDIDKEKVCAFGTSSGGNTALLLGLTQNDAAFEEGEYLEENTSVTCVVDCFGPADLDLLVDYHQKREKQLLDRMQMLGGGNEENCLEKLQVINPVRYIVPGKKLPPFLILHGDADTLVPFEDSERLYEKLVDTGYEADLVQVRNAPHEDNFWSKPLLEMIFAFMEKHLKQ